MLRNSIWQKCASRLKNVLKYIGNYFHVKETIKVFIFADKTKVKVLWKSLLLFISPSTEQSGRSPTWNNFRTIWVWNTVTLKTFFSFYIFLFFISLGTWKDLETFQSTSLGKKWWLTTPFQFLMASSKSISGLQLSHKSREPVNVVYISTNQSSTNRALTIVEKRCKLEGLVL